MFRERGSGSPGRSRGITVPESGVCSEGEEVVVRVVVEVFGRDEGGQDVDDAHTDDLAVQQVLLVERAVPTLQCTARVAHLHGQKGQH